MASDDFYDEDFEDNRQQLTEEEQWFEEDFIARNHEMSLYLKE